MNTENSMIQRIEALPEARKNTILETMWLLGKLQLIDNYTIETLVRASEQVEMKGAKAVSREDFYEQEQRDDEADNMPDGPTINFENPTERDKQMIDAYVKGTWKPFETKLDNDTVLVDGYGTMCRYQAVSKAISCIDKDLKYAFTRAANGPAYKEAK